MKEPEGSAKIAEDAIAGADHFRENTHGTMAAWFRLAYAALRILANIADTLDKITKMRDVWIGNK